MYKKKAALVFIFISNIILLASAVIPHHHHHSQICFLAAHCQNDLSQPDTDNNSHNHNHNGNPATDLCLLKQAIVLPANQARQEIRFSDLTDSHSFYYSFQSPDIKTGNPEISVPLSPLIGFDDGPTYSYSCYINSSLGLRAPPAV